MKEINFDMSAGEWAKDLLDAGKEKNISNEFKFYPCEPITITDVYIYMKDDYNGHVKIQLSNGHEVEYKCEEVRGNCGPDSNVEVSVNRPNASGFLIAGDEFLEEYSGSGSWVNDIMRCYMDFMKKQ